MSYRVFLSHSERDTNLAAALKTALAEALGIAPGRVFVSSDGSIRAGEKFPEAITKALQSAQAVVVLLTPNSLWAPWVHFEAGGAYFSKEKELFVVAACGVRPPSFPSDLSNYSVKDLGRAKSVRRFLKDVASLLKIPFTPPSSDAVAKVVTAANTGSDGWHLVKPALVASEIGGSPFELRKLLEHASNSAFLIGQNLWRLTEGPHARAEKRALFDFLKRRGTSARILIQADGAGAEAWNSLLPNFGSDLAASLGELRGWLTDAQRLGINKSQ